MKPKNKKNFTSPIFSNQNQLPSQRSIKKLTPEEILSEFESAFENEEYERAYHIWDSAPRSLRKEPIFLLMRASVMNL